MKNYQGNIISAYNSVYGIDQTGAGLGTWIKKGIDWAKRNKAISKVKAVTDAVGATNFIDSKTGGLYSKGVNVATQNGFGRRRRRTQRGGCSGMRRMRR